MGDPAHSIPYLRAWNIALRTSHLAVAGILVGGHVFAVAAERLLPWLYLTIATGAVLLVLEAYPSWRWCREARGIIIIAKLLLTCLVAWLWEYRVPILIGVIALGSVGSHLPRRFRYFSPVDLLRR